jgi:hypothetical protein
MSNYFFPGMSHPAIGGVIFNILMLAAPFVGFWLGGPIGLLIGMSVACIGWIWFFFIHGRHGGRCEICGRPVINLGRGSQFAETLNIGTFINTGAMRAGLEGPGNECLRCGRVYCTHCATIGMTCKCRSKNFRTVRLRYG